MSAGFNAAEVFELARQIERYGERFYRIAAERVDEDAARRLLLDLADYEVVHEQTFRTLQEAITEPPAPESTDDLDDTAAQYLKAMANGAVFQVDGDPSDRLQGDETVDDFLRLALQMEQTSIAFYSGIKRAMPASWGPERVEAIIQEEMLHVVYISTELARRHGASS